MTKLINIKDVKISNGRRALRDVTELAKSINEIGLLNPITIAPDKTLIAGLHRLEACRMLGWQAIEASILELDSLRAELAEIDENLQRNELTVLDQAQQLARRKRIYEALYPETKYGNNQYTKSSVQDAHSIPRFTTNVSQITGQDESTIRRKVQIAENITPDIQEIIKDTPIADNQSELLALARLEPEQQRTAVEQFQNGIKTTLKPLMTSASPEWYTPQVIIERVIKVFGKIDLDPCSNSQESPNVPAATHYTQAEDGLSELWFGRVYMNPPYGDEIKEWIEKLAAEYDTGHIQEAIALLPARTDTAWMRRLSAYPRCFVWGRLKFSAHENSAPFPSVVIYLGEDIDKFTSAFDDIGDVFVRHYARF